MTIRNFVLTLKRGLIIIYPFIRYYIISKKRVIWKNFQGLGHVGGPEIRVSQKNNISGKAIRWS